jgi:hypothetical protein
LAVNPLNLAEYLRPWHTAGITLFFMEGDASEDFFFLSRDREERESPFFALNDEISLQDVQTRRDPFPKKNSERKILPGEEARLYVSETRLSAASVNNEQATSSRQSRAGLKNHPDWPDIWQTLLTRTEPAPLVWTYAELGEDLIGFGNKARSACLRRIIGALQLPKGSSSFWPVCLNSPVEDAAFIKKLPFEGSKDTLQETDVDTPYFGENVSFFQAGLHFLAPRIVIMLGSAALALSGVNISMVPFTQQIYKGALYVLLPDFAEILSKPSSQEDVISEFLRTALAKMALS